MNEIRPLVCVNDIHDVTIMAEDEEVFSSVCYVLWDKTVAREAEVREELRGLVKK